MTIVLKKIPEDFRVQETQAIHKRIGSDTGPFRHFSVRKKNYETFDVVAALSSHYGIARQDISFCGLKDKDGVTEQYVSVRCGDGMKFPPEAFNEKYYESDSAERFMHLRDAGPSNHELVIADLLGNTFDMVVRSIDPGLYDKLDAQDSAELIFINYYDVQRFGVPGGAKITHLIGEALHAEDYEQAIALINRVADSDDIAGNPIAHREDLFARLDKRKLAFLVPVERGPAVAADRRHRRRQTGPRRGRGRAIRLSEGHPGRAADDLQGKSPQVRAPYREGRPHRRGGDEPARIHPDHHTHRQTRA
jgi:tRNA pseudouridine13 synthase